MKKTQEQVAVFWFRRDLRLNDNHGLFEALNSGNAVLPLFIFDKNILDELQDKKDKRVSFIFESLELIQKQLLESDSSLLTIYDDPLSAFKTIVNNYKVQAVFTNEDYEPYAIERDKRIAAFLNSLNISFHSFKDQVIFEKDEILKTDGSPYTIFTPYSKKWKEKLNENLLALYKSENFTGNFLKGNTIELIALSKIGFERSNSFIPPIIINKNIIQNYHETRNFPAINGTSNLSVHLRFGTVSVRLLVKIAMAQNEAWLNELIWREFFMMILYHFPNVVKESFKKKYDNIIWSNNEEEFSKWCKGETGYPIVDAGMRELNESGFMHNRVRMIVASFLTKHLLIDWRWGEAYFAEKLIDYDLSANNGNWQWAAGCGCDAAPYFRIFNPYEQVKKFDPDLVYIKKWVKNLNQPGYPQPIVEHKFARERVLKAYKTALDAS